MKGAHHMSEYRDIHNHVLNVIERTVPLATEEEQQIAKEAIINELFRIFSRKSKTSEKAS